MRIAISNLAWDRASDEQISLLLNKYKVDAIEIVPSKYFPPADPISRDKIRNVREWWLNRGIEIIAMQSLLYGFSSHNIFGPPESQNQLLKNLNSILYIGAELGVKCAVFGSPKSRDRLGLNHKEATKIAIDFFKRVADSAEKYTVTVCIEPIPICYGSNFLTSSLETLSFIQSINNPFIKMQFDTGAITKNNEDFSSLLRLYASEIAHIHASEPSLLPLFEGKTKHIEIAPLLQKYLPDNIVSIEMLPPRGGDHLLAIERSIELATRIYKNSY